MARVAFGMGLPHLFVTPAYALSVQYFKRQKQAVTTRCLTQPAGKPPLWQLVCEHLRYVVLLRELSHLFTTTSCKNAGQIWNNRKLLLVTLW